MQTKIAETPNDSVVGKTTQISSGLSADSSIPQSGENVNPTGASVTEMQQPKGIEVRTYESDNEESRLETLNKLDGVRFSKDVDTEADSKITQSDIEQLRSIGRKSIFDFTHEDIQKSEKWAKKFYSELGEKSPFFRAWFGDWRANDTEKINIVSVPTIDIKDATLEYGDYHINDTGWDVYAGRTLKDDTMHHSGGERINVKSLNAIESILKNAVLFDTVVSENNTNKKAKNTAFLHKLYTPITYNNSEYIAVTTVEEYYNESVNDISRRAYNLKSIKIEPADGRLEKISTSPMSDTGSTISISDLYSLVKSNDKNFKENPASKVVNEDGTPRIVYHYTNGDFTVFNADASGSNQGKTHGDGIYVSTSPTEFKYAGKNRMELYDIVNQSHTKITEGTKHSVVDNSTQMRYDPSADSSIPQSGENVNHSGVSVTEMQQSDGEARNSKDVFTPEEREKIISKGYTCYLARQFVVKDKSGEHAKAVFPLKNNHKQTGACRFVPEIDCARFLLLVCIIQYPPYRT